MLVRLCLTPEFWPVSVAQTLDSVAVGNPLPPDSGNGLFVEAIAIVRDHERRRCVSGASRGGEE
jgi:hypothetical protein